MGGSSFCIHIGTRLHVPTTLSIDNSCFPGHNDKNAKEGLPQ